MPMLARCVFAAVLVCAGLGATARAQALIGDEITLSHRLPNIDTLFDGPYQTTVTGDDADAVSLTPFLSGAVGYVVNPQADRLIIDYLATVSYTAGVTFHGLLAEGLDYAGTPAVRIVGVDVVVAPPGFPSGRTLFGDDWIAINFDDVVISNGSRFVLRPVVEPVCLADLAAPFGLLDLADINAFVGGFVAQDPVADLDRNGLFDLTDVTLFIAAFVGGCP